MEVVKCPHCGEQVLAASLEEHWEKKRCVQKGEEEIWAELNTESVRVPKNMKTAFCVKYEEDPWWRLILNFIKRKASKNVAWVWVPEMATKKQHKRYLAKVRKLSEQGYTLKWMEG